MREQMALAELERLSTMVERDMCSDFEETTNNAEDEVDMFNFGYGEDKDEKEEQEDEDDGEVNCLDDLCLPE